MKRKLDSEAGGVEKRVKVQNRGRVGAPGPGVGKRTGKLRAYSSPPELPVRTLSSRLGIPQNTAFRAKKRESFDRRRKEKTSELEQMMYEDKLSHCLREDLLIREMRKGLVFRAQPIRQYSTGVRPRNTRSLTVPRGPKLRTAQRAEYYNLARGFELD